MIFYNINNCKIKLTILIFVLTLFFVFVVAPAQYAATHCTARQGSKYPINHS